MTRNEYLRDLRQKLSRLPQSERDEAMAFYSEYFEDAGDDAAAIESLGSSIRLAAQINAEFSARMLEAREQAFKQQKTAPPSAEPVTNLAQMPAPSQQYTRQTYTAPPVQSDQPQKKSSLSWIWAVILGIFALPVALPVVIVAFVVVIVVISVCFAVVVALIGVVIALLVGSFCTLFGIGSFTLGWGGGLISIGGAIALLGLAFLLIPLIIRFCVWLVNAVAKLVTRIFNSLKRRTDQNEKQ